MKKTVVILLALALALAAAGCGAPRTAITAAQFTQKAEAAGYAVQNSAQQYQESGQDVEDALIAVKLNEDETAIAYQIEFVVVPTAEQAQGAYTTNKAAFDAAKGTSSASTNMALANYAYYYLQTNGKYMVISRIDNTFVYINADAEYKDDIKAFLKEIGY